MTAQHEPTSEGRAEARALSGFGIPQEQIAQHLGIDPKTLRLHYREELDAGMLEANRKVAETLFGQAMKGNTACMIFWAKARMGWSERSTVVHEGLQGAAAASELSNDQLAAIASGSAAARPDPGAG